MADQKDKAPMLDKAVALKYDAETDNAPIITAIGIGPVAQRIKEMAAESNIPLHEDRNLVEVLQKMELGKEIPVELYAVMAEILAWVFMLEEKRK